MSMIDDIRFCPVCGNKRIAKNTHFGHKILMDCPVCLRSSLVEIFTMPPGIAQGLRQEILDESAKEARTANQADSGRASTGTI